MPSIPSINGNIAGSKNSKNATLRLMPRGIKNKIISGAGPAEFDGFAQEWLQRHSLIAQSRRQELTPWAWTDLGRRVSSDLKRHGH